MPVDDLVCTACGDGNAAGSRFCATCGAALVLACPSCGAPASGRFCSQCGSPLSAQQQPQAAAPPVRLPAAVAERRLTSVLFADLVGFTPLSEARDAEEVRELLSRYFTVARTVIARYGGTVEKFIGDAVMAVWGVPTAREDDAERAVRAALDLVDAVAALGDEVHAAGLRLRAGIVTGEVATTVGAVGEGMVAGDAVNTAARVQAAAAPGEVWVDNTTRTLTSAAVAYTDAGVHSLKGKSEPVALFAARQVVAAVGGAQRVDGLEAPFVGRDRELRLVKELFHATLEEGRPRLVSVWGLPGIGKSRLGWEFFKHLDGIQDPVRWHRGRCLSYGDGVAFWALAEMVRSRLDILEGDDVAVVVAKLDAGLRRWVPDDDERSWLAPRMATLLGIVDAVAPGATFSREDLFASWQLFFERLITDGATGVALLVEDVQWADDGLLDFLDHLLERSQAAIFLLTLSRPELAERRPGWGNGRRATPIYLEPLPAPSMAALVDGLVDGLPEVTRSALVTRAEGIPLYAVETVRSLIDRDVVVPHGGHYVLAPDAAERLDLDAVAAPTSLHTLLAARLDALTAAERRAVQNAAVLGLSFTRHGLAALTVATGGDEDVDATLGALVRKEILALDSDPRSPERGQYRFVQSMVRSVAYDTLSRRDRKARHLSAAEHLAEEPDVDAFSAVLAAHYLDARAAAPDDPDADELARRAVELLERAAKRAAALGAPAQAQRHYGAALALVTDDASVGRLAGGAGRSALRAGLVADAVALGERAAAAFQAAGQPIEAGLAMAQVAEALNSAGQAHDVPGQLEPVYASLDGVPGADVALMRLAQQIGRAYYSSRSDPRAAFPWLDRATEVAEAVEDWAQLAESFSSYASALVTTGRPTMGLGILRIALDVARQHDLVNAELVPLNNLAAFLVARDVAAARLCVEEGLVLARRLGDRDTGGYLIGTAMHIYWVTGEWDATLELLQDPAANPAFQAAAHTYRDSISAARGEPLDAAPSVDDATGSATIVAAMMMQQALRDEAAGDLLAALPKLAQSVQLYLGASGFDDDFPTFWAQAVDVSLRAGQRDTSRELLSLVTEAPRGRVTPLLRALSPYFRARLAATEDGDSALVDADFTAGTTALREFGAVFWLARCLLDHAEWLTSRGRGDEATPLVDEADRMFTSLRATPWVNRAQQVRAVALR